MSIRWALVDQAVVSAGTFAFGVALVRILGVDTYGAYSLIWGGVQLLIAIQGSLYVAPFLSLGGGLREKYGQLYSCAVFIQQQFFSVIAVVGLASVVSMFVFGSSAGLVSLQLAVAGSAYFALTQEYIRRVQLATARAALAIMGDVFRYGVPVCLLVVVAAYIRPGLGDIFLIIALSCMFSIVLGLKPFGALRRVDRAVSKDVAAAHWPFVKWLMPSIVFQWINANIVFYAVGWFYGEGDVGILRVAQVLSLLFLISLEALENVVPVQAVIRMQSEGISGTERYIARTGICLGLAFVVFLGGVIPWTEFWLRLLYGEQAAGVGTDLVWMFCMVPALMVPTYCFNVLHRSLGITKAIFIADSLASLVSLVGALIVVWGGLYLAILTMLCAQAVRLIGLLLLYRRARALSFASRESLAKAV